MTADELLRHMTNALFVIVFAGAAVTAVRERTRPAVDAAIFFGVLAAVILESAAFAAVGVTPPELVADVTVILVLALPAIFVRLVDDLVRVPRPVVTLAAVGLGAISLPVLVTPPPLPPWLTLPAVAYFAGLVLYGSALLVREAGRATGVSRRRMQAAAFGSMLLGVVIAVAGIRLIVPVPDAATRVATLAAALLYVAAFTPPAILRRGWREPGLSRFLGRAATLAPTSDLEDVLSVLQASAGEVVGAAAVDIVLLDGADQTGGKSFGALVPESLLGRAIGERRPVATTDLHRDDPLGAARHAGSGARSAIAAPMIARGTVIGGVVAYFRRIPLFLEEDVTTLEGVARECASVVDSASAYARLAETNQRLETATRAKTEFLANMSHELRTPLNATLGFSELLLEQLDPGLTPQQRRYFDNIRMAGQHLLELINEVLDLSKVEAGKLEVRLEFIGVRALIEPALASARAAAEAREIELEAEIATDREVRVDAGRIRQVLYNLLSNAVKFTDRGGHVRMRAAADGRDLVLEVSDTGIGIPPEARSRVFGSFERLHEDRPESSGTGLGLALSKRLVELHGGTIGFESAVGKGTTFHVRLPNAVAEPMTGRRVLIIEDDARDAELVAALASSAGLRSEVVQSAAGARAALRRDPPTAVVLDLRLPDERGERVLEEIKAAPSTSSIPVIVVTVEDDDGRSRPLGAEDHLTKPIDPARLNAWIRRVVSNG